MESTSQKNIYLSEKKMQFHSNLSFSSQAVQVCDKIRYEKMQRVFFLNFTDQVSAHEFMLELASLNGIKNFDKKVDLNIIGESDFFSNLCEEPLSKPSFQLFCSNIKNIEVSVLGEKESLEIKSNTYMHLYIGDPPSSDEGFGEYFKGLQDFDIKNIFLITKKDSLDRDQLTLVSSHMKYFDIVLRGVISLNQSTKWWEFWK